MDNITTKQRAFVLAYLVNGFNGVQAARTAGYRGNGDVLRSLASDNTAKPNIAAAIRAHR